MRTAKLLSLVIAAVLPFVSVPVGAQQPVAPPPPQIPYGAPISFEQAKKVMAGAETEAIKNKWNMVIAILDTGGHLVMLHRLDGTQLGSIEAAKDKAYSAVLYRRPTKVFQDLVGQGGPNLRLLRLAGASPLEGGIPLVVDGKIIGAIGVSGAASLDAVRLSSGRATASPVTYLLSRRPSLAPLAPHQPRPAYDAAPTKRDHPTRSLLYALEPHLRHALREHFERHCTAVCATDSSTQPASNRVPVLLGHRLTSRRRPRVAQRMECEPAIRDARDGAKVPAEPL